MATLEQLVDDDVVEAFRRDGVAYLPGAFSAWVDELRAGVARNMAEPGPTFRTYARGADGAPVIVACGSGTGQSPVEGADALVDGRFFNDYCNWDRIPEYRRFVFESPAGAIAARLMGSETVRLFHEHVLVKEPSADVATPWHQDGAYYCVRGTQTVSFWIPLDHVTRERTLEFVPGSNREGVEYRPERFNRTALVADDGRAAVPDIDADREGHGVVGWEMQPGDAVAFQYWTLHGAPANTSRSERRRAFSLRLFGDDARFAEREVTSPPFPGLELRDGDVLDVPQFPRLV